jgi:hypothetical protein
MAAGGREHTARIRCDTGGASAHAWRGIRASAAESRWRAVCRHGCSVSTCRNCARAGHVGLELVFQRGRVGHGVIDHGPHGTTVRLYASGQSLVKIGAHLGVDASTVHKALKKAGVKLRDHHGRTTELH